MTTLLQPGNHTGPHPGPDQLSAFAENALPPHEQQQTLAHLATCPDCRNLVNLAQQATPIELPQPVPARRPWYANWNLLFPAAFALAALIFLTIHLRSTNTPNKPTATTTMASVQPPQSPIQLTPEPTLKPAAPVQAQASAKKKQQPIAADTIFKYQEAISVASNDADVAVGPAAPLRALSIQRQITPDSAINGLITDPSGAVIPHAKITATNTDTGVFLNRETAATGTFSIPALQAGDYNVEVTAPGFQRLLQENVHVQPNQQLALNMKLNPGGSNQTVTVTDAPPALDTANATIGGTIENELYTELPLKSGTPVAAAPRDPTAFQYLMPGVQEGPKAVPPASAPAKQTAQATPASSLQQGIYGGAGQTDLNQNYIEGIPTTNIAAVSAAGAAAPATINSTTPAPIARARLQPTLPSHLPALSTVTNARQSLAIDTAGALFRSQDAGVTWKPIPTQWKGRATRLALTHPPAATGQAVAKSAANTTAAAPQHTPQTFELTTDTNATYTSPDGQTWRLK